MSRITYKLSNGRGALTEYDPNGAEREIAVDGVDEAYICISTFTFKMRHGVARVNTSLLDNGSVTPYLVTGEGRFALDSVTVSDDILAPDLRSVMLRISKDLAALFERSGSIEKRLSVLDGAVFGTNLF